MKCTAHSLLQTLNAHLPEYMLIQNEDRILEFLDGRLTPEAEEELLHTLAVSPERRSLLRSHLKLRELTATLTRESRFAVPDHVTGELFRNLTALGFSAPVSTEAILTNASQYVRSKEKERDVVAAGVLRENLMRGVSAFRVRMSSVVMACFVSFLLGIGAFYVFGNDFGLVTLNESHQATSHAFASHRHSASAPLAALPTQSSTSGSVSDLAALSGTTAELPLRHSRARSVRADLVTGDLSPFPSRVLAELGSAPPAGSIGAAAFRHENAQAVKTPATLDPGALIHSVEPATTYTGPSDLLPGLSAPPRYIAPFSLGDFVANPFSKDLGVISFRFGSGRAPNNPIQQWSSLTELKFTWVLGNYFIGRASLGQFMSHQLSPRFSERTHIVSVADTMEVIPVAGLEAGITLAPISIPLEISGGIMADGAGNLYPRGGVYGHLDLLDALSLSVGIEGMMMASKHNVQDAMQHVATVYRDFKPQLATAPAKETVGFIGPSIEIGWHF